MAENWASMRERGAYWGVWLMAALYRVVGRRVSLALLAPAILFFYVAGPAQRRASHAYLTRVWKAGWLPRKPGPGEGLRHYMAFGAAALDKFAGWIGDVKPADLDGVHDGLFEAAKRNPRGGFVITAHIGNPELIRAVATMGKRFQVNVLMHTAHAESFNRLIARVAPEAPIRIVEVSQIDAAAAIRLSAMVDAGEWVVITGDRMPPKGAAGRGVRVRLLGAEALLPQGPYVLAAALKCPCYVMFCTRRGRRHQVRFVEFADPLELPRGRREEAVAAHAQRFAGLLEAEIAETPFQWFNFYDFWGDFPTAAPTDSSVGAAAGEPSPHARSKPP